MADPVPNTNALPVSARPETMNPQPTDMLPLSRPSMQLGNRSRKVALSTLAAWIISRIDYTAINDAIGSVLNALNFHASKKDNPHSVTKDQVGLGNADNTSDLAKPIGTATQAALNERALLSHSHAASAINSGVFDPARIPPTATAIAAGTLTRAANAASGNEVVSIPFLPSYILFSAVDDADPMVNSDGWDTGTIATSQSSASVLLVGILTLVSMTRKSHTASIFIQTAGNIGHSAKVSAKSATGFTLAWTRIGLGRPITVKYLAVQ